MTKDDRNFIRRQAGAALVESILIIAIMVVLLVGIPSIAKRQDVRQSTVDANRYTTWEMTVANSTDRELVIDRFFADPGASIRSAPTELDENRFWQTGSTPLIRQNAFLSAASNDEFTQPIRAHQSLVDPRSVRLEVFERAADAGAVADTITGTVRTVSDWTGYSDAIAPNRGIVQTALSVGVGDRAAQSGNQPAQCSGIVGAADGCISVRNALLVDGWEAENDAAIKEGAQAMVPSKLLDPLGEVLDAISVVPLLKEFKDMDDSFGCVNTSLLPTKELTGNISTATGNPHDC